VTSKNHNLYAHYFASFGPHLDKLLLETDSKQVYTYRDADLESARLACFLIAQGLQPGDRVSGSTLVVLGLPAGGRGFSSLKYGLSIGGTWLFPRECRAQFGGVLQ